MDDSPTRKICIVTGSRAEYGLLFWLIKEVAADVALQLQIVATGMHLSPEFGLTYREIERDGFAIDAKVEMLLSGDNASAVTKSLGLGIIGFADAFDRLKPDVVVILGDRFEILAAAQAAALARVPIAHIHGGETTEGAFDESVRHAITKFSQLHFVAAEPYRQRVVQMGEAPDRVFIVGAPGLEYLRRTELLASTELAESLGMPLANPLFVVTYHPATLGSLPPEEAFRELLSALEEFPDATIVFTYPNADTGGRSLVRLIDRFVAQHAERVKAFVSLGQRRYLSLMHASDVVVGNSSSGLIEAPALKKPTVNIGDRQKGRIKARSIIDAEEKREDIVAAIRWALSPTFRESLANMEPPYGGGDTAERIVLHLKSVKPTLQKPFFDIQHGY